MQPELKATVLSPQITSKGTLVAKRLHPPGTTGRHACPDPEPEKCYFQVEALVLQESPLLGAAMPEKSNSYTALHRAGCFLLSHPLGRSVAANTRPCDLKILIEFLLLFAPSLPQAGFPLECWSVDGN